MAGSTAQIGLSTTPAELTAPDLDHRDGSTICIEAPSTADLWVGFSATVTAGVPGSGYPIRAGLKEAYDLEPGERLWGVLASGTGTACVIRTGV